MRKKDKKSLSSGIQLSEPKLVGQKGAAATGLILDTLLVLLGVFGAVRLPVVAFSLPVLPKTFVLYTLLFAVVLSLVFHLKRMRHVTLLLFTLMFASFLYLRRDLLLQGYYIFANLFIGAYAKLSGFSPLIYTVSAKQENYETICTVFLLCVSFLIAYCLCWAIATQHSFLITLAITLPFLLIAVIFNGSLDFYSVLLLASCWGTLLFTRLPTGEKTGFITKRGKFYAKSLPAAAKSGALVLPVLLLCFLLILTIFPAQSFQRTDDPKVLREHLTDTINNLPMFEGSGIGGSSNRVNLNNAGSIRFSGNTMLRVKLSKGIPLYLKGFTGERYDGYSWDAPSDADFSGVSSKLNGISVHNLFFEHANRLGISSKYKLNPYEIQVKNLNANKQTIYFPYNITTTPKNIINVKYVNDSVIKSAAIFGISDYNLYAYHVTGQKLNSMPSDIFVDAAGSKMPDLMNRPSYSQALWRIFTEEKSFRVLNKTNLEDYYKSSVPEMLMDTLSAGKKELVQADQSYRSYLYDHYTQLPDNIEKKVKNLLKREGISTSYSSISDMADAVTHYLAKTCKYTLSPGSVPAGQDFTDYFLFESKKGYCVHFATAATVMLRAMGLPARYAEGYIVTNEDLKSAVGGWADIRDNRAHAWVEIYYPGFGWQPIEATPGFSAQQGSLQDRNPEDYQNLDSQEQNAPSEVSVPSEAESNSPASGTVSHLPGGTASESAGTAAENDEKSAAIPIAIALVIAAALITFIIVKRRAVLNRRSKLFGQEDTNRAAIAVYGYLTKLARYGGTVSEEISDIALKARFSQHRISREELNLMQAFAKKVTAEVYVGLSKTKKVLFRYFDNLN